MNDRYDNPFSLLRDLAAFALAVDGLPKGHLSDYHWRRVAPGLERLGPLLDAEKFQPYAAEVVAEHLSWELSGLVEKPIRCNACEHPLSLFWWGKPCPFCKEATP